MNYRTWIDGAKQKIERYFFIYNKIEKHDEKKKKTEGKGKSNQNRWR